MVMVDWISYSNSKKAVIVDLGLGTSTFLTFIKTLVEEAYNVFDTQGNIIDSGTEMVTRTITISEAGDVLSNIENVFGSNYDDHIIGDSGVNWLGGGLGSNTIDGAGGADFVYYSESGTGVRVNLGR